MNIRIDLNAKILPDDHRVYIIFPGRGYTYFDFMFEKHIAFLELPNVPIELLDPTRKNSIGDIARLNAAIVDSILLRRWKHNDQGGSAEDYLKVHRANASRMTKTIDSYRRTLVNFYYKIPDGSLFLLPAPTISGRVLIGEFLAGESSFEVVALPDSPTLNVFVRRVRWLNDVERYKLNGDLLRRLSSPNPVRMLEQSYVKFVYDIAYGQYKYNDEYVSRIDTESITFDMSDNLTFNLCLYHLAKIFTESGAGHRIDQLPAASLDEILKLANIIEQRININSPGSIVLAGKTMLPFLVIAFFAASSVSAQPGGKPTSVTVSNSMQDDQIARQCSLDVKAEFEKELALMGYPAWQVVCRELNSLREKARMNSTATGRN